MKRFSVDEWKRIFKELDKHQVKDEPYGLPERRKGSFILSSFNIRALGNPETRTPTHDKGRTQGAWDLLARYVSCCDFIAIQEVKDNLLGILRLKESLKEKDKYALIVSDVTGARPGRDTTQERLAFLYRWDKIQRTELASDITFDRRAVVDTILTKWGAFMADFKVHDALMEAYKIKLKEFEDGKRSKPKKPSFVMSNFLTFIRTPHVASFSILDAAGESKLPFLAVNAHLLYGQKSRSIEERKMEFDALVDWLRWRTKSKRNLYHKTILLFGDMNLEFKKRFNKIETADEAIKAMNKNIGEGFKVNFPFLDTPDKRGDGPNGNGKGRFTSTARKTQTYDQIGFFGYEDSLPDHEANAAAGLRGRNNYDYGVFFFADLFAKALHNKNTFQEVSKSGIFVKRFEHDVSDHHPIWVRLPVPK